MTPTSLQRCVARLVPGLLVLVAGGCGLGEYEKRMAREQQRAEEFDKLAGDPLELPPKKEKEERLDVFVLPPRGVSVKPEAKTDHPGFSQFKGARDANFANVYLGWPGKGEDLQRKVLDEFGQGTPTRYETEPWDREEGLVLSEMRSVKNRRTYYAYLMPENQGALVYELAKSGTAADEAVKASLNTLALDKDATQQRSKHAKRRRPAKK